jgi:hypothetical protein
VDDGTISRDDVTTVMLALLDSPRSGTVIEAVSGSTPVAEAVAALR